MSREKTPKEALVTDTPGDLVQNAHNLFYIKDGETWVRGYAEDARKDCTLRELIRRISKNLAPIMTAHYWNMGDEELDEELTEALPEGVETPEGVLALLYTAAWSFSELRAALKTYEEE